MTLHTVDIVIVLVYLLLTTGETMAQKDVLTAAVALWLPNVVFTVVGLALFLVAARERPLAWRTRLEQRLAALRMRGQTLAAR